MREFSGGMGTGGKTRGFLGSIRGALERNGKRFVLPGERGNARGWGLLVGSYLVVWWRSFAGKEKGMVRALKRIRPFSDQKKVPGAMERRPQ